MTFLLILFVFIFGAGLAVLAYFGISKLPERMAERKVEARLRQIQQFDDEREKGGLATVLKGTTEGPLPALEKLLGGTTKGSALARLIEQSGMKGVTVSGLLLVAVALSALVGICGTILLRASYALPLGAALGFVLPFIVLRHKRTVRMHQFEEQFPEALDLIARSLKAGHAFANGMKMAADELPDPVGPEFRKTFDEQNFGLPLKDALDNLSARMPLLDVRFFATAVLIQRDTGGNLSEILENLAHVVRERFKILRQVRVYTAHGRLTGYVLLALPFCLAIALMFINPEHMDMLFKERMGKMMLGTAAVMQFVGYMWIRQVIKIEV
jgi:tight adherence protein B